MTKDQQFERICKFLSTVSQEKFAFFKRLLTALENDHDGHLHRIINSDPVTLKKLLDADDIAAADRWLRRGVIRLV